MAPTQGWRLQLWGAPGLMGPLGVAPRCEGKALALLVYLALEGPSTRARLADLLWPQTGAASRNNLVVLLRRMRQAYGEALWTVSGPLLTLGGQVEVVRGGAALLGDALPLAGWDTPELPEFSAWIAERRQSLRAEALQTLREQAQGLEARGAYAGSRTVLRRALDLEPFSEETARALMRAEYLSGDPAAALRTFSDLRLTLERDLNVVPTALTLALAEEIRQAARSGPGLPPARSGAVPTPLAAPQLIGRQAQWQAMSAAWTAGQAVVLTGEAGVGKSRLARDFAVAWEAGAPGESRPVTAFCGRPSDAPVPYAAVTRSLREVLARQPGLPIPAPTRRTLAALLPERFGAVPPPERDIGAALDTALREVFALALTEGSRLLLDDVHLMDAASARLLLTLAGTVGGPAMVACVRDAEVPASVAAVLDELYRAGRAVRQPLGPLDVEAGAALLHSLGRAELGPHIGRAVQFAGGRPLFLLETARHLLAQAGRLPPAGSAEDLIGRWAEQLSPEATQVARAAAVLSHDLRPEVLADMLGLPLLSVVGAWQELTSRSVVAGDHFTHDLVRDVLLGRLPPALRALLHRTAARALARDGAPHSRLALHWEAGDRLPEAARALVAAGDDARSRGLYREALAFFRRAQERYDRAALRSEAFLALVAQGEVLYVLEDEVPEWQRAAEELQVRAVTPREQAQALLQRARLLFAMQREAEQEEATRRGLALAQQVGDAGLEAELLESLAGRELHRDYRAAQPILERLNALSGDLRRPELRAWALEGLGLATSMTNPQQAPELLRAAEALHLQTKPPPYAASASAKQARALYKLGQFPEALAQAQRARKHLGLGEGFRVVQLINAYGEALCLWALGKQAGARRLVEGWAAGAPDAEHTQTELSWHGALELVQTWLHLAAGEVERAQALCERGRENAALPHTLRAERFALTAAVATAAGDRTEALAALDGALALTRCQGDLYLTVRCEAHRAALQGTPEALRAAARTAQGAGLSGLARAMAGGHSAGGDPALALSLQLSARFTA
ncbi:ATP-binding protein [Deinococcus hopiensis]|uniref:Predicted ATPase n=1 Tax=Deinococcus hopiensis KR-140 TaxID=695939 RepID=A0A1W1UNB7_9DEIO|nr:AAA family ATPase [Deinococcus hopiensis]SMB82592.1 Predicted ATPase [Deinococcus hopiensis KR-140]